MADTRKFGRGQGLRWGVARQGADEGCQEEVLQPCRALVPFREAIGGRKERSKDSFCVYEQSLWCRRIVGGSRTPWEMSVTWTRVVAVGSLTSSSLAELLDPKDWYCSTFLSKPTVFCLGTDIGNFLLPLGEVLSFGPQGRWSPRASLG